MHPAYSVIIFTTFSGAGYGLLVMMALFALIGIQAITMLLPIDRVAASVGCISYGQFL